VAGRVVVGGTTAPASRVACSQISSTGRDGSPRQGGHRAGAGSAALVHQLAGAADQADGRGELDSARRGVVAVNSPSEAPRRRARARPRRRAAPPRGRAVREERRLRVVRARELLGGPSNITP
jgi:hypothetical protein